MARFSGKHSEFFRVLANIPIIFAVVGAALPPLPACGCDCRAEWNRHEGAVDAAVHSSRPETASSARRDGCVGKRCCRDVCRCAQSEKTGSTFPCCCAQPPTRAATLPEQCVRKTGSYPFFASATRSVVSHPPNANRPAKRANAGSTPVRLHVLLCVFLN